MFVFSSALSAQAASKAELDKKKDRIQQEIESAQEKINVLKEKKSQTEEYVAALQGKVSLLQDRIDNLEEKKSALQKEINAIQEKISSTEVEIERSQKEIDAKQREFELVYDQYCKRLRAMYISGNVTTLEVLLESGDMSSVLTRAEMVKCVSSQDSETLDSLMKKMQEIEKQKQALEEKKLDLKKDKENLDKQKNELQSSINEISASKKELDADVAECNASIRSLNSQTASILETIETNEARLKEVENEIRRALQASPPAGSYTPGSGVLGYPTSSRTVSAGYPNYASGAYHGGVDFRCPTGTAVYAADSGYVSLVKSLNYSYGKYIIINHGNGLSTLYAHNSSLVVSQGQSVSKGQIIAYSGESGNATGPHCHFEVRLNGNRVNPFSYLG